MNDFLEEWFKNKDWWFIKNDKIDLYLTNKYEYLLNELNELNEINEIGLIILYDQLVRHIFRNKNANHIILYFLNKAIKIIEKYKYNQKYIDDLSYNHFIFFILPLRHTNIKDNILYSINQIKNKKPFCKKFLEITYKNAFFAEKLNKTISDNYNSNILEFNPIEEINFEKYKKIGNFSLIDNYILNEGIISLSGGVDSMVCLINCIILYPKIKWTCININYKNREETDDETKFIAFFCNKYNIDLYVRNIDEINRDFCKKNDMREIYEEYTKRIRFNSYKSISNNPIVILGHNKDDIFENILTNISNNNKYENLNGMKEYSEQDDIIFIRPLLDISKDIIYNYAHELNIPYLKNSTPKWSQRGKIRNNIVPVLLEWNPNIINGLYNLSNTMEDLHNLLELNINTFVNKFNNTNKLELNKKDLIINNKLFWKNTIIKICKKYPSNKSIKSFIERLELWKNNNKNNNIKIIISKDLIFEIKNIDNENIIIIFSNI